MELNAARSSNGFGPMAITYTEIASWAALMGVELERWEVQALRAMDSAALSAMQAKD